MTYNPAAGAADFLALSDTPGSYAGQQGLLAAVNAGESALEFVAGGGGGGIDYSTAEQDTGINWHDGKDIFQKTIVFGALPNNATKDVAHAITTIDEVVDHEFWARRSSDNLRLPMPHVNDTGSASSIQLQIDNTNLTVRTSIDFTAFAGFCTIFYTKV